MGFVYTRVVYYNYCWLSDFKRKFFQLRKDKTCVNICFRCEPMGLIASADESPNINFIAFLNRYKNLFSWKLPAVWYVASTAHMTFISVE